MIIFTQIDAQLIMLGFRVTQGHARPYKDEKALYCVGKP